MFPSYSRLMLVLWKSLIFNTVRNLYSTQVIHNSLRSSISQQKYLYGLTLMHMLCQNELLTPLTAQV